MAVKNETKACTSCAKSKRRCDRSMPTCSRCSERGIDCLYPADRASQFVLLDDLNSDATTYSFQTVSESSDVSPSASGSLDSVARPDSHTSYESPTERLPTDWFTYPESWKVTHWPKPDIVIPEQLQGVGRQVIGQIHQWLVEWIVRGSNPWMHHEWYKHLFPESMQDAYSTFASCLHQTPENAVFLAKLLERRVDKLLSDNKFAHAPSLEPSEHVARVQAMLVYQMLGLYGKDDRQRDLAEGRIPLFNCWLTDMLSHCSQATTTLNDRLARESISKGYHSGPTAHLWCSWILSETIRRTWLVGFSVIVMYDCLKYGRFNACQGGPMFTTRAGAWEAETAELWEELGSRVNFGLLSIHDAKKAVASLDPEEVDVLAKALIDATYVCDLDLHSKVAIR